MNSAARMALHRLASHIISTLLTCSDTAIRVAKAMIGAKASKTWCLATIALFLELRTRTHPQDLWPYLISETGLKFLK